MDNHTSRRQWQQQRQQKQQTQQREQSQWQSQWQSQEQKFDTPEMNRHAYVHDWLFFWWWAEKVFIDLIHEERRGKPNAVGRVFTLFSDQSTVMLLDGTRVPIVTALPQRLNTIIAWISRRRMPILSTLLDYRNMMVLYPLLVWIVSWKIRRWKPQYLLISSFAAVKNIRPPDDAQVTLYMHSPNQYVWTNYKDYLEKFSFPIKQIFMVVAGYIRQWDKRSPQVDTLYVNSKYTAERMHTIYGTPSAMMHCKYPSLGAEFMEKTPPVRPHSYFLYCGRLVRFIKEVDKIITLANMMRIPLLIMGTGPDEGYLRAMAGDTITFLGAISDPHQKKYIIGHAAWCINLTQESFGLVTAESLSCGVPVFGYGVWGTAELVGPESGYLVQKKDAESLRAWRDQFAGRVSNEYNRQAIQDAFRKKYTNAWGNVL
jgi:glycosyltransferase involved in cell wall biosynthesis